MDTNQTPPPEDSQTTPVPSQVEQDSPQPSRSKPGFPFVTISIIIAVCLSLGISLFILLTQNPLFDHDPADLHPTIFSRIEWSFRKFSAKKPTTPLPGGPAAGIPMPTQSSQSATTTLSPPLPLTSPLPPPPTGSASGIITATPAVR